MRIAVIGATGFVGSHLVPHLAAAHHTVVAVSRRGRRLPDWGESIEARAADVETGIGVSDAFAGADAAVHLVAIPRETGARSFEEVNVGGTRRVLEAAAAVGIRRLVHLSVLGVTEDPRHRYLSSKWRGEQLVRQSDLDWVVLRPSIMFGEGDGFFSLVKTTLTWWSPGVIAIPGSGEERFQPLSADDLAIAVERSATEQDRFRSVYELGGPDYWSYRQIVDEVMRVTGKRRMKVSVPASLIGALTVVTDRIVPFFPVSHDQIGSLGRPNFTDSDAFERAFGVRPRPLDVTYLAQTRIAGRV
jgi:uncharacterized protein YbjT (DUF2867 family)